MGSLTNQPESTLKHHQYFKDVVLNQGSNTIRKNILATLIAWNEVGKGWMLNKDWAEGEKCFKKSIESAREAGAEDPTATSLPKVNLGLAYWLTQRYVEAASTITEALQEREAKFGKDDRESFITGRLLHALGNVKKSQSLLDESLELHRRSLRQYLSTIGRNHQRTGDAHVKVAEHCMRMGEWNEAR